MSSLFGKFATLLKMDLFREVGFPFSVCLGSLVRVSCPLAVDSISISRTGPEHALTFGVRPVCDFVQRSKEGNSRLEFVSIDVDGPTDRCSACNVVHFISPDNRDAKIPRLPWNSRN